MEKQKRQSLNAEKRKAIADVFENHWTENSPMKQKHTDAINNYNAIKPKTYELVNNIVRKHQPQEDVNTIRGMIAKYNSSGGDLHHDNCFYLSHEYMGIDEDGKDETKEDKVHIDFTLTPRVDGYDSYSFANSYYRDEMKAKGLNPDYDVKLGDDYSKKAPKYYQEENSCKEYLGITGSNNTNRGTTHYGTWENSDKIWVIGTSYCHSRNFKTDETSINILKLYTQAQADVCKTHRDLHSYVETKMQKLRLGLKSYKYFDQAKELADKLGIPLNEGILNESSSMALSVYSPENLANLLEDKVEPTKAEKIAIARQLLAQQIAVN